MHMAHYLEKLQEFRSCPLIVELYRISGDVCVAFFTVPPGNKDAVTPNPLTKEKAVVFTTVMTSAYQDQQMLDFPKYVKYFKSLQRRIFKIRSRFLHTGLLLWRHFHAPKRDTERNELWLVVWHVAQTASWAGLGQWKLPYIPDLQPSVWRSGYARLGVDDLLRRQCLSTLYLISEHMEETMV